jgi:hypothetical protein
MRVQIQVRVYEGGYSWTQLAEQEVEVTAPIDTLDLLAWDQFCASLVPPALIEARVQVDAGNFVDADEE